MGPMTAAADFLDLLRAQPSWEQASSIRVSLHGSLAFTGKGHATDRAVALGLLGWRPSELDIEAAERQLQTLRTTRSLTPRKLPTLVFDPASDIVFDYGPPLPGHANGMIVSAYDAAGDVVVSETYYSIDGGFVVTAEDRENSRNAKSDSLKAEQPPFPFASAAEMLRVRSSSIAPPVGLRARSLAASTRVSLRTSKLRGGR